MSWLSKKYQILFLSLFLSLPLMAQKNKIPFNGAWKGVITQADGYRSEYNMELYLQQDGRKLSGISYVSIDTIFAEMSIEGIAHSKSIILLKDLEILDNRLSKGLEWCMKNYQLVLKREGDGWKLEGKWQGKTTSKDCDPGTVNLQRIVPRA